MMGFNSVPILPQHFAEAQARDLPILSHCTYHSECADQRLQDKRWVSVHWCRHAGHTPPVSKVFHSFPQVQNQH